MTDQDAAAIERLHAAFAAQKAAYARHPDPPAERRREHLRALIAVLARHRDAIHDALASDYGAHPRVVSDLVECAAPIARAEMAIAELDGWMAPEPRPAEGFDGAEAFMVRQPKGVVGMMSPWNFPFELTAGPLVDMLAAGDRVIIKPSELAPACADLLARMVAETFAPDHVTVAVGGLRLAEAFPTLPWDHLMFTGGTEVGRKVMRAAAENLTPVTLELGGKCPVVILEGGLSEEAVEAIVGLKRVKNGQVCVSADHVLVPRADLERAAAMLHAHAVRDGRGHADTADATGVISERHARRLRGLIDDARAGGAEVRVAEPPGADHAGEGGDRRLPLHLVLDPGPQSAVMREEVFGPVLPLVAHDGVDDAIARINAAGRPLAIYVFGADGAEVERLVRRTVSGGVTINGAGHHTAVPTLGFGGSGASGIGRHHGVEGFREFSNLRAVLRRPAGAPGALGVYPPYGPDHAAGADAFFAAYAGAAEPAP